MANDGALSNVKIDGVNADITKPYNTGTKVNVSTWNWKDSVLN